MYIIYIYLNYNHIQYIHILPSNSRTAGLHPPPRLGCSLPGLLHPRTPREHGASQVLQELLRQLRAVGSTGSLGPEWKYHKSPGCGSNLEWESVQFLMFGVTEGWFEWSFRIWPTLLVKEGTGK